MRFFVDSADVDEIRKLTEMGVVAGVTTNPTLISKTGKKTRVVIQEICEVVKGHVCAETIGLSADEIIKEGRELAAIAENVVIKIPVTEDGIRAVSALSEEGIKTNVTLVFSALQALLAARAGATYVCPFVGRVDDTGTEGMNVIAEIRQLFDVHAILTEIIVASIRNSLHVKDSALIGADIATVPPSVFSSLLKHPLTDAGIQKFLADAEKI